MEDNRFHTNHMNIISCLPPRKRLLARLNGQSCENAISSLASVSSESCINLCENLGIDVKDAHISPEKIVEFSRSAALAAAEVAAAAKANALEKAAAAAKASVAAKSALELFASFTESSTSVENYQQRNKQRKHVPMKLLYKRHLQVENHESDEELARRLHRAINSSPRILKNSINLDLENGFSKIVGHSTASRHDMVFKEAADFESISPVSVCDSVCGRSDTLDEEVKLCSIETNGFEVLRIPLEDWKGSKCSIKKYPHSPETTGSSSGKKIKIKQKKLPLSLCNMRDGKKNPKRECP